MGMDISGINPDNEVGVYFRANIWGWYPILDLIAETGIFSDEDLEMMGMNIGAGPKDAETANRLADALEGLISGARPDGEYLATSDRSTRGTGGVGLMLGQMLTSMGIEEKGSAMFSADVGFVKEFIEFCRHSGGFEIW